MASIISIANGALLELGADPITVLTENTKAARLLNIRWDDIRDAVLRAHPWNFATVRKELAPLSSTPAFEFDYEFQLPTSSGEGHCLRVLDIENADYHYKYKIEGRKILYNENILRIKFVQRVTDISLYDALFNETLGARLAVEFALNLTGDQGLAGDMWKLYEAKLKEARFIDGAEGSVDTFEAETWLESRVY